MANETHLSLSLKQLIIWCIVIFLFAFAIRTLTWQDNRFDAWKVQTSVTHRYKESAQQLVQAHFKTFLTDVGRLGHPPGYPIVLAVIYRAVGQSDTFVQFLQIAVDSAAVVILFLISLELFSASVSVVSGLLAALSPQFAYFSVLLLPDSMVVLPILLAVYLVVRGRQRFSWLKFLIAGLLIGISCWLRANALLLPLFVAGAAAITTIKGRRLSAALSVIAGAVLAIAPITIKNAIVFHTFIPVSLGSGQTLLEGLADYDPKGSLNIPKTDRGITRQEAQWYGRPDYALELFEPDGIQRDRMRVRRGLKTIAEHPLWFASAIGKRAIASTRLDPVPVLQPESPVTHELNVTHLQPQWIKRNDEWGISVEGSHGTDDGLLKIRRAINNDQSININSYHDYVFTSSIKVDEGRIKVTAMSGDRVLASTFVEPDEVLSSQEQPVKFVQLPFVSSNYSEVRVVIVNAGTVQPSWSIGETELFDLGPSSMTWIRYVRIPLRLLQMFYKTAWTIPFLIVGIAILVRRKQTTELLLLMAVPAYYLIVQSALHTERRYVYAIHFFFLVIVSVTLCWGFRFLVALIRRKEWAGPPSLPAN